jgi:hypothetical protein
MKGLRTSEQAILNVVETHYVDIMLRMVKESNKAGRLGICDVLSIMDFTPNADGKIQVLQDPPQIQIVPTLRYLDAPHAFGLLSTDHEQETTCNQSLEALGLRC